MRDVIAQHTSAEIIQIDLPENPTVTQVYNTIRSLFSKVKIADIVLCPWQITANNSIDSVFEDLAEQCWVVVAAGNSNQPINKTTPARVRNVHTVGCLNKTGVKATLSNYSSDPNKKLEWVSGTNYHIGNRTESGTSVSAALYAAFLAEAILVKDHSLVQKLIDNRKMLVAAELLA